MRKIFKSQKRRVTCYVALLFFIPQWLTANSTFDKRILWVVRDAMTSSESIDEMLSFAKENNFNHLLVQVRGRGDAYYQSEFVPRSTLIIKDDFDPLDYILSKAESLDIEIHAWLNMYYLWSASTMPLQKKHLLYTNPEWLDKDSSQNNGLQRTLKNKGNEGFYLAPTHPDVSKYLMDVVRELVQKYPVDGIHLDYIRFHKFEYGKNPIGLAFYNKHREEPMNLSLSMRSMQNIDWNRFKRKSVTKLVKGISNIIQEKNENCILSAAVKPNLYEAKNEFGQEWDVWLLAGYLDWAIPMNYLPELEIFSTNIQIIDDNLPKKYRSKIVMGLATYNQNPDQVEEKIKFTQQSGFKNICLFSYNVFRDSDGYFGQIKKHLIP
ncbi:MAG: family 10 glycosylhydrolase [Candidatus Marinimicrobia bacterium]|nr:family 10 glycosylhydrolase [Candidatus Neomarinimicrobiota bacterium]MBT4144443.1 family 10 glycosylhydrolase [Candidatus Neomarinimicrobiota bacterium]MBT4592774.1 family 10 glycosylhydrolase [Candidatus Neomarinimicrobiota bacterium]MBT6159720.1 family 10 glycosylhydrolase [Candidatus Neomarinimicrobiota bacterium]MBT7185178.1 family 10 glycosylhydrolase [Candidatus Neomarinimicrobiota bacterium]